MQVAFRTRLETVPRPHILRLQLTLIQVYTRFTQPPTMRAALFILCLVGLAFAEISPYRARRPSSLLGRPYSMKQGAAADTSAPPVHAIHGPDMPLFRLARDPQGRGESD